MFALAGGRVYRVCNGGSTTCAPEHLSLIAGAGTGALGDNGPAYDCTFNNPSGIAMDRRGNIYVADTGHQRIREECSGSCNLHARERRTVAGGGASLGDGGPAIAGQLNYPNAVALGSLDDLYIADRANSRVRRVCVSGNGCTPGNIDTVAGTGVSGNIGDGGPATSAQLYWPYWLTVAADETLYISDYVNRRIRRVCGTGGGCAPGTIDTLTGADRPAPEWEDKPNLATKPPIAGLLIDATGDTYFATGSFLGRFCTSGNGCTPGLTQRVAGGGGVGSALVAPTEALAPGIYPRAVTQDANGDFYLGGELLPQILKLCRSGIGCEVGKLYPVAGNGLTPSPGGTNGDGGPALGGRVCSNALAFDGAGDLFVSDSCSNTIRRICFSGNACTVGYIDSMIGDGQLGFSADGTAAGATQLRRPTGLATDPAGNIYYSDGGSLFVVGTGNFVVRKLCRDGVGCTAGTVSTVAGTGIEGSPADEAAGIVHRSCTPGATRVGHAAR